MPLVRHRLVSGLAPEQLAGDPVDAHDRKLLWFPRIDHLGMQIYVWRAGGNGVRNGHLLVEGDRGQQKNSFAPNNRSTPPFAIYRSLPSQVFRLAPSDWRVSLQRYAVPGWPPPLRPVFQGLVRHEPCGNKPHQKRSCNCCW